MRYEKIGSVLPDVVLASSVVDDKGNVVLKSNTVLTECLIQELRSLGIKEVCIYDNVEQLIDHSEPIKLETRVNAINALKSYDLDNCLFVANLITNDVLEKQDSSVSVNVRRLLTFDNYTFNHSVDVAVYSTMVGINLGYDANSVKNLTIAGLLHDVGKILVSRDILFKQGILDKTEFAIVKRHSVLGYDLIKYKKELDPRIKLGILQHHENEDGTGYPCGLVGDSIVEFAKIIHVCDVFDALVSKRCYKDPVDPGRAAEYLVKNTGTLFDKRIVDSFISIIDVYTVGQSVKLSDGRVGVVKEQTSDKYRPVVCVKDERVLLNDELTIEMVV